MFNCLLGRARALHNWVCLPRCLPRADVSSSPLIISLELSQAAPLDAIAGFGQKGCCRVRPFSAFGPAPLSRTIQAPLQLWPQHQHLLPEAKWLGWTEHFTLEGSNDFGHTKFAGDPHPRHRPAQWFCKESGQVLSCGFSAAWYPVFSQVIKNLNTSEVGPWIQVKKVTILS